MSIFKGLLSVLGLAVVSQPVLAGISVGTRVGDVLGARLPTDVGGAVGSALPLELGGVAVIGSLALIIGTQLIKRKRLNKR